MRKLKMLIVCCLAVAVSSCVQKDDPDSVYHCFYYENGTLPGGEHRTEVIGDRSAERFCEEIKEENPQDENKTCECFRVG